MGVNTEMNELKLNIINLIFLLIHIHKLLIHPKVCLYIHTHLRNYIKCYMRITEAIIILKKIQKYTTKSHVHFEHLNNT